MMNALTKPGAPVQLLGDVREIDEIDAIEKCACCVSADPDVNLLPCGKRGISSSCSPWKLN